MLVKCHKIIIPKNALVDAKWVLDSTKLFSPLLSSSLV